MVRKASTLTSLNELKLSAKARNYFLRKYTSIEGVIWHGRYMAYNRTEQPDKLASFIDFNNALIEALDKAGFIRHDITIRSFCVGRLYHAVYREVVNTYTSPCSRFEDFGKSIEHAMNVKKMPVIDYSFGNKRYEEFETPSEDLLDSINIVMKSCLNTREQDILKWSFGFIDGRPHQLKVIGSKFSISAERVRQIEVVALRKLKAKNLLPSIIASTEHQWNEVAAILNEIKEIHESPLFKREAELRRKLFDISQMPFDCANEAKKYTNGCLDKTDIELLGLSVRPYNCLKRAGINTIADIVNLPKNRWMEIKNLGHQSAQELIERMRDAGYTDFII